MKKVLLSLAMVTLIISCKKSDDERKFAATTVSASLQEDNGQANTLNNTDEEILESNHPINSQIASNTNNIDVMLDDYDKYVDQYLLFIGKMGDRSDMSVMSEYPALIEKGQQWTESMERAEQEHDFTPAQMRRMLEIQNKMTQAVSKIEFN